MADLTLTRPQWMLLREAIAGAQLFVERVNPTLRRVNHKLDGATRQLIPMATRAIGSGFNLMRELSQDDETATAFATTSAVKIEADIDVKMMRSELENCAALNLGDIGYEIAVACGELDSLIELRDRASKDLDARVQLHAAIWEAGRRYGCTEAIALFDATSTEYINSVDEILGRARDRNLELPPPHSAVAADAPNDAPAAPATGEVVN